MSRPASEGKLAERRVLIVEDDEDIASALRELLVHPSLYVEVARNGVQLMVGFQARHSPFVQKAHAAIPHPRVLIGQMIDRSGMAWCIQHFGREEMLQIAIEEWMGASPIYTPRESRMFSTAN